MPGMKPYGAKPAGKGGKMTPPRTPRRPAPSRKGK
jgi:hypothetical protein